MIVTQNGPQSIDQVKTFFECGNLFLSPDEYQREGVWKLPQKRLLVDTIFRGMDIPKLYFWKIDEATLANGYPDGETKSFYKEILDRKRRENDDLAPYVFEAVDGQQRIRTILEFMGITPPNDHCYRGTWHDAYASLDDTPMAKGRMYSQLNAEQRIQFGQCRLTIMVLENAAIGEVRDMFLRLQNGTPLNAQQKRNAKGSRAGQAAHELASLPFFTTALKSDNSAAEHERVVSQMLLLESKDKIVSCTSPQLDAFYQKYLTLGVEVEVLKHAKKVIQVLGSIFPTSNPGLNRSYALGLYWSISRILKTYQIDVSEYPKILQNFEKLDQRRLEAMDRDYLFSGDELYEKLSLSMSHGTDGSERIADRFEILTQFLYEGIDLKLPQQVDPNRNFTYEERLILYRRAGGKCQLGCNGTVCGRDVDFDDGVVDHITPHSRGGVTSLENGRFARNRCNISRGIRDDFDPQKECCLLKTADK